MALVVDFPDSQYNYENSIIAVGLAPYSLYEITLLFFHKSGTFKAFGVYRSDEHGTIDPAQDAPIRGTYSGVRKMGLFESYVPCEDFPFGGYTKYLGSDIWNYKLRLIDSTGKLLDTVEMIKRFMHPSLRRIEIDEEGICGTVFIPPGDGPFPSIIDMSGTGGGINEQKAAALASEGFCVLTLAFFQFKHLPKEYTDVELEYFIKTVNWFSSLPYTSDKIGLHGNSAGGLIVLLIARECPQVGAVVSITPPQGVDSTAYINFQGKPLPRARSDDEKIAFYNGILRYDRPIKHMDMTGADLHLERIPPDVPIRFVGALDDISTPVHFSIPYLQRILRQPGRHIEVDWQNGGHLMEPPCFPHLAFCYSKMSGTYMGYGGEASQHGASESKVWKSTVEFFKKWIPKRNIGKLLVLSKL